MSKKSKIIGYITVHLYDDPDSDEPLNSLSIPYGEHTDFLSAATYGVTLWCSDNGYAYEDEITYEVDWESQSEISEHEVYNEDMVE